MCATTNKSEENGLSDNETWSAAVVWTLEQLALSMAMENLQGAHRALRVTNYKRKGIYSTKVTEGSVEHATDPWNLLYY